jgi:uncharacterized protein (DUF2267 family)
MIPLSYENATADSHRLLRDARDEAGLVTTNQSFTMVEGVLRAFRRRLEVDEALAFAAVPVSAGAGHARPHHVARCQVFGEGWVT